MVNHFSATGAFSLFCYPINNSYLPPPYANSPMVAEVTNTSNRLVFSDPSNHRNSKVQMAITGLALPFFAGLTFVGVTHGAYLWSFIMGSFVLVAVHGWLRAIVWFVRPFEFNVEFTSDCLRIWDTRNVGTNKEYRRTDIRRILIERPNVTFGTKSSRIEKGFPGIQWTDARIDELESFLAQQWPEVRIDRL